MTVRKPPGQPTISVVLYFFKQYSPFKFYQTRNRHDDLMRLRDE